MQNIGFVARSAVLLKPKCIRASFLCPKCDNFASLHIRQDQNELHLKRGFFFPKSASSVSRLQAHLAKWKRIGWSIGFTSWTNWTLYVCIRLNDDCEIFNCCKRRWIDVDSVSRILSATVAIFSGVCTVFGFTGFYLSMLISFTFFSRERTYEVGGAYLLPKSARNFRAHSATLPWFSK